MISDFFPGWENLLGDPPPCGAGPAFFTSLLSSPTSPQVSTTSWNFSHTAVLLCTPYLKPSEAYILRSQFIVIHTVEVFGIVNKAEIGVFLELSCFFDDPADVGNLISGSSVFSQTCLNIRKFTVHVLLKPGLENFEHYLTSV